jgi:hypothetical protein
MVYKRETYDEIRRIKILDPSQKKMLFTNSRYILLESKITRGEIIKRIVPEPNGPGSKNQFCGLAFPKNNKLYKHFNRKIIQLFEAGITGMYREKYEAFLNPKYYEKPRLPHKKYLETTWRKSYIDDPKVLTMEDLEFGFVIWFGSLILPFIGFVLEWLIRLRDFLFIKYILTTFFKRKHAESSENTEKRFKMFRESTTISIFSDYYRTIQVSHKEDEEKSESESDFALKSTEELESSADCQSLENYQTVIEVGIKHLMRSL